MPWNGLGGGPAPGACPLADGAWRGAVIWLSIGNAILAHGLDGSSDGGSEDAITVVGAEVYTGTL